MLDLGQVINKNIKAFVRNNVYTSLPAEIIAVDRFEEQQIVDVKPLIKRVYEDGVTLESANIYSVPVVFPSAGGGLLSFPIAVGDTVLLLFTMRSLEDWLSGGGELATPVSTRSHSINDAIAIPGLYTRSSHLAPNPLHVELKFNDLSFRLETSGDIVLENPSHSLTLKSNGDVLHSSGAKITASGDFITAAGISLDNHTHTQSNDSNGDSQQPTNPPS